MIKAFDTVASSGYLRFSRQVVVTTKELSSNVVCDFDQSDKLVAIECIDMGSHEVFPSLKKDTGIHKSHK